MPEGKIILISLFYNEADNGRGSMVYNLLKEKGISARLVTADFNHQNMAKRASHDPADDMVLLPVPEYKRNISLRRIYSHFVFAKRLAHYLKHLDFTPSKIYCQVPTVTSGWVARVYSRRKEIPLAIDVIDLWPESLVALYAKKKLVQLLSFPLKWLAQKVYGAADMLFTGSVEYAGYVQQFNKKTTAIPIYLGIDNQKYQLLISKSLLKISKPQDEKWICFGGSLGKSYDFELILDGFKKLVIDSETDNIKLIFIGDGQERDRIEKYRNQHNLNIEITGYLSYADYLKYLSFADVAINSFREGTRVAYSYKFNDYVASGIPIVNNVKGEMADIVEEYNIGRNFEHNVVSLADCLNELINNPELLKEMKKNTGFVASEVMDKDVVYKKMLNQLIQ